MPPPKLRLNPSIEWSRVGTRTRARLPLYGIEITGSTQMRALCDLFAGTGLRLGSRKLAHVCDGVIRFLTENFLVIEDAEFGHLQHGLVQQATLPIGRHLGLAELRSIEPDAVAILHAPIELSRIHSTSVANGGQRVREHLHPLLSESFAPGRGPPGSLLIDFDLGRQIGIAQLRIRDFGDIVSVPELDSASSVGCRLTKAVRLLLEQACRPVILGGDHTTTFFVLQAVKHRFVEFGVIHFDAHHDFYLPTGNTGPYTALNHANVLCYVRDIGGVRSITQIGLRDLYRPPPNRAEFAGATRIEYVSSREASTRSPEELLANLDPTLPYYVTFDVDVLEAAISSTTATPVFGGIPYWRAFDLVRHVFERFKIIGLDLVEIGGQKSPLHATADFAARMVMLFAFTIRKSSPISTYTYV